MIHINKLSDCHLLTYDPDLQREVTSYLLYCRHELLDDIDDFDFMVLAEADIPILNNLGTPEETVQISIKADGHIITIYRIVRWFGSRQEKVNSRFQSQNWWVA